VLVDGDDMNEPISDSVRGILDGHIVLDRKIAERGRFPAVNIQKSISRMLPGCHDEQEYTIMKKSKKAMSRYSDMEDLIQIGAYRSGTDPEIDAAIHFSKKAETFLTQKKGEVVPTAESFQQLEAILFEARIT
jgi:flagellum-specific ATP synthase